MGRFFVLAGAVLLAPSAFASFELALIVQSVQQPNNGPTATQISRYDAGSGAYLGKFGVGFFNTATEVSLNPSVPGQLVCATAYTTGELNLDTFNYSTGEQIGSTILPVSGLTSLTDFQILSDGTYFISGVFSGVASARTYTSSGSLARTYTLPSGTTSVRSIHRASNGNTFILTRQPGTNTLDKITLSSYGNNLIVSSDSEIIADDLLTSSRERMVWLGNNRVTISRGSWSDRRTLSVTGTALGVPVILGGYVTTTDLLLSGHGSSLYGYGYDSTNQRFTKTFGSHNFGPIGSYEHVAGTTFQTCFDGVMVVAPEPGTMIALGLGVAALARRRRQTAKAV